MVPPGGEPAANAELETRKAALDAVLASKQFSKAPRLRQLLRYIGEKALNGNTDDIKEYSIAVEALGRPSTFDCKKDSIVRVNAHEVRKRLVQYYACDGAADPIILELPVGRYVPCFTRRNDAAPVIFVQSPPLVEASAAAPPPAPVRDAMTDDRRMWFTLTGVLTATLLIVFVIALIAITAHHPDTPGHEAVPRSAQPNQ